MENTTAAASEPASESVVATVPISVPTATAVVATEPSSQEDPKPAPTSTELSSSSAAPVDPPPPAETQPETETKQITPTATSLAITVLVQSGVRHDFVLDRGYLERHIIKSASSREILADPMEMTVAQLKECLWKDWMDGKKSMLYREDLAVG